MINVNAQQRLKEPDLPSLAISGDSHSTWKSWSDVNPEWSSDNYCPSEVIIGNKRRQIHTYVRTAKIINGIETKYIHFKPFPRIGNYYDEPSKSDDFPDHIKNSLFFWGGTAFGLLEQKKGSLHRYVGALTFDANGNRHFAGKSVFLDKGNKFRILVLYQERYRVVEFTLLNSTRMIPKNYDNPEYNDLNSSFYFNFSKEQLQTIVDGKILDYSITYSSGETDRWRSSIDITSKAEILMKEKFSVTPQELMNSFLEEISTTFCVYLNRFRDRITGEGGVFELKNQNDFYSDVEISLARSRSLLASIKQESSTSKDRDLKTQQTVEKSIRTTEKEEENHQNLYPKATKKLGTSIPMIGNAEIYFFPLEVSCQSCQRYSNEIDKINDLLKEKLIESKRWKNIVSEGIDTKYLVKSTLTTFDYDRYERKTDNGKNYYVYTTKIILQIEISDQNNSVIMRRKYTHGYDPITLKQRSKSEALEWGIDHLSIKLQGLPTSIAPVEGKILLTNPETKSSKSLRISSQALNLNFKYLIGERQHLRLNSEGNYPVLTHVIGECTLKNVSTGGIDECKITKGKKQIFQKLKEGSDLILISSE